MIFHHQKIIVTGANRSIGRKIAIEFAKQGADVVVSYRSDKTGAEETVAAINDQGRQGWALHADFSKMDAVAAFAEQAISLLGGVDVLVNNAAMLARGHLLDLQPDEMQAVFQVNVVAPLYLTQLCTQDMIRRQQKGSVISISSIASTLTVPKGKNIVYGASKAAVNKWTQSAALGLAAHGIRVNAVAPGVIAAGMNEHTSETNPELWDFYLKGIPLQRAGEPQDIAQMVLFLASEQASWITGQVMAVDGGHAV